MSVEPSNAKKSKTGSGTSAGGESVRIIVQALALAMVVRIFFFQPFNIPSGSMKSTLLIGDYLFVSKLSYGYSRHSFPFGLVPFSGRIFASEPKRGDVIVFKLPTDNSTDYIKRLIGLPGDTVQMRAGHLYINGKEVPKRRVADFVTIDDYGRKRSVPRYEETLPEGRKYLVLDADPNGQLDNTAEYRVPTGHYFMMGDNRDNSTDSRVRSQVGVVPFENLVGRADLIWFSAAVDEPDRFSVWRPWTWPFGIRWSRFFGLIR